MNIRLSFKLFFALLMLSFFYTSCVYASTNVLDVNIVENVYEVVNYNPRVSGSGIWFDSNENESLYNLTGSIIIENNHNTDAVQDIVLNVTGVSKIYGLSYSLGSIGYVTDNGDSYILSIPDLGPGSQSIFTYSINTSLISPPINFTTNYSDLSIFAGLDFGVTDKIHNSMNESFYSDTCIFNLSVIQEASSIFQSPLLLNFTFNSSITGLDATNASISADNQTLTWNVWNKGCFGAGNVTDISYNMNAPAGVAISNDYEFTNTTIFYNLNSSVSGLSLVSLSAIGDLELNFQKYMNELLTGDNATWKITSEVVSQSNITLNLTSVTLWVSQRNATGTGFTNPSQIDNDTINTATVLQKFYTIDELINNSINPWTNLGSEWYFNYTYSSSPIVWMDLNNTIYNDGVQLTNRSYSYGNNSLFIKEIYVATGYWLQITKNITRLAEGNFSVFIQVVNLGSSPTPANQAVVIYNFLPITVNLSSVFVYSDSTWYNTSETNESLNDAVYNGTMYQYALLANGNPYNSSLDKYSGSFNLNNTWNVTFNVTGSGNYTFDDLFLTGVDPLNVREYGGTKSLNAISNYRILSASGEYLMMGSSCSSRNFDIFIIKYGIRATTSTFRRGN